jgi:hypothetical protein
MMDNLIQKLFLFIHFLWEWFFIVEKTYNTKFAILIILGVQFCNIKYIHIAVKHISQQFSSYKS